MKEALPDHARGKPVEVWFQDEARVGQQGTLTRIWARRGTRPRAPRDRRYAWAYLFGAVCPERAVGAALVLPYADAAATGLHLAEIGRHVGRTLGHPVRGRLGSGAVLGHGMMAFLRHGSYQGPWLLTVGRVAPCAARGR